LCPSLALRKPVSWTAKRRNFSTGGSYSPNYKGNLKNWKLQTRLSFFSKT
jgi:hypothetical protein